MRPFFFFLFLGLAPLSLLGQAERDSVDIYCIITSQTGPVRNKTKTSVDYGKKGLQQVGVSGLIMADKESERETFETMAEAMNHLSARGWQYVEMYGLVNGAMILNHCIMRKRVPAGEVGEK